MPVGERSSRPGETIVACRASPPTRGGATKTTNDRCAERVVDRDLLVDVRPDLLAQLGQLARLVGTIAKPSAAASTNAQNAPP